MISFRHCSLLFHIIAPYSIKIQNRIFLTKKYSLLRKTQFSFKKPTFVLNAEDYCLNSSNKSTVAPWMRDSNDQTDHIYRIDEYQMKDRDKHLLNSKKLSNLNINQLETVIDKFNLKGLKIDYMDRYNVCISNNEDELIFPFTDMDGNITYVLPSRPHENLHNFKFEKKQRPPAIFGWPLFLHEEKEIVLTNNMLDAIAINQTTNIPAVSLLFENEMFPLQVLEFLGSFKKVLVWFESHLHNWKLHKHLVENLDQQVFVVRTPTNHSTALNLLQNGSDLKLALNEAYPLKHDAIETFAFYKDDTFKEFSEYDKSSGVKWKRFPVLNEILKGHRKGELTILSGQTGTGKTTFISEYSLDLCMQKVPTLWGSFEIKNSRLIKTIITQFSKCTFVDHPDKFHQWAVEFNKLPFFFMNFNGEYSIRNVINAMKHALFVYTIEHVIIDNLQFMMNADDSNNLLDHLRRQDQIFAAFRQFATQHNCHVTLVIHPRKEPENTELTNMSISGSAKGVQEADNILLLQSSKTRQYIQVTKNRFDGAKGYALLEFDKKTLTFTVKKTSVTKNMLED